MPSLHTYLEDLFANTDIITDDMIKRAKRDYRKMYVSDYQKLYKEKFIQITFRLSKKQYEDFFKQAKKEDKKVSTYIKHLVLFQQNNHLQFNINEFKILLLQIMDLIEEAIQESDTRNLSEVLELIEQLQRK